MSMYHWEFEVKKTKESFLYKTLFNNNSKNFKYRNEIVTIQQLYFLVM